MPTRWLTGPLQKSFPTLAQTSGYATDCGGRHFSTRPGAGLPHVGSLFTGVANVASERPIVLREARRSSGFIATVASTLLIAVFSSILIKGG